MPPPLPWATRIPNVWAPSWALARLRPRPELIEVGSDRKGLVRDGGEKVDVGAPFGALLICVCVCFCV